MSELPSSTKSRGFLFCLLAMLLTSMAAGTGWGIRGQYGHESGAMIAGALASLTLILLFVPQATSLTAARAAAMMTVAIGMGGSMTYGQTVGLTHDAAVVGNWDALRWGMLGLFLKGGLWISFGGLFLGIGLSGKSYKPLEMLLMMLSAVGLLFLGIYLLNTPFDPATKTLPRFYFSDNWIFEPAENVKPRVEIWGGYLFALIGLLAYIRFFKGDKLATRLALICFIGGGLGFSGGQSIQASHAWNPELYSEGVLSPLYGITKYFNWWNIMETTFGCIWGAAIALGLYCNRHLISVETNAEQAMKKVQLHPFLELTLCVIHIILLVNAEFLKSNDPSRFYTVLYIEFGFVMAILPLVGSVGGRFWPYLVVLPIVAIPVAGKTIRLLSYQTETLPLASGWIFLIEVPLLILSCLAVWLICRSKEGQKANEFSAVALVTTAWIFFGLNSFIFHHAWPWEEWTGRTANQTFFGFSTVCLTIAALVYGRRQNSGEETIPIKEPNA